VSDVHAFFLAWDLIAHLAKNLYFYLKPSAKMFLNHVLHAWVTSTISGQIWHKWVCEHEGSGVKLNYRDSSWALPKAKTGTGTSIDTFKS